MDGDSHQFLVEYDQEELKVLLIDQGHQVVLATCKLQLADYLKLDNGSAYLGFVQETSHQVNVSLLENWSFVSKTSATQQDPWGGLSLDYSAHWPLHLVFSPDVIEKYNVLFRFLLPIKRVQLDLQHVWSSRIRSLKDLSDHPNFRKAMQLRQHMSFLIDNLFSYLQVDVLESQWTVLEKGVRKSVDFEEVRQLHEKYLSSITAQCFLNLNKVLGAL